MSKVPCVVLNYSISRVEIASIHRVGCGAIEKDMRAHGVYEPYGPFESVDAAMAAFVDDFTMLMLLSLALIPLILLFQRSNFALPKETQIHVEA